MKTGRAGGRRHAAIGSPSAVTGDYEPTSVDEMAKLSHFLNLDLVLKSNSEFSALIGYLDQSVFVLTREEFNKPFLLALETNGTGCNDPAACTRQSLTLIESLPDPRVSSGTAARRAPSPTDSRAAAAGPRSI
jgi:hypothetical protein